MMKHTLIFLSIIGFSTLLGCSAQEDEVSNNDTSSNNLVSLNDNGLDPNSNPTAFLTVVDEFDFKTNFAMGLDVDIGINERAFFQVCTEYVGTTLGSIEIDYDSCVIQTPLDQGVYKGDIPVTNDRKQLVAEIQLYSETAEPMQYLYDVTDRAKASWVIR